MPDLRAERQLAAIEAAAVPHMGPAGQQDVFSRYRTATKRAVKAQPATAADLAAIGISVVEFDSTKES